MKKFIICATCTLSILLSACSDKVNDQNTTSLVEDAPQEMTFTELGNNSARLYVQENIKYKTIDNTYIYTNIVKYAFPKFYEENESNKFKIHSRLDDAINLIYSKSTFVNKDNLLSNEYYTYGVMKITDNYDYKNKTTELESAYGDNFLKTEKIKKTFDDNNFSTLIDESSIIKFENLNKAKNVKISKNRAQEIYESTIDRNHDICVKLTYHINSINNNTMYASIDNIKYSNDRNCFKA